MWSLGILLSYISMYLYVCTCTEDVVTGTYLLEIFCANIKSNTHSLIISTKKIIAISEINYRGPQIARKFFPKILCAIQNSTIWIYTSVRAENWAIARSHTYYDIKSSPFGTKNLSHYSETALSESALFEDPLYVHTYLCGWNLFYHFRYYGYVHVKV